ncbi:MAG: acyl-CoA thioester hydrolase [Lentimonas sp.]|jgi:acyl-CoA thioester hydrolase
MIKPFELQLRFRDLDLMGHVNNSVYLSFFEMTRVYYFEELLGRAWDYKKEGFLLAKNEVEYFKPIFLRDKPKIHMNTTHVGNKSFTLGYEIYVESVLVTKGSSIMVAFDSVENKSIPIPLKLKETLLSMQGSKSE